MSRFQLEENSEMQPIKYRILADLDIERLDDEINSTRRGVRTTRRIQALNIHGNMILGSQDELPRASADLI